MKKVILTAVCLFSIATVSNAQEVSTSTQPKESTKHHEKLTPEQHAQKNVDQLNTALALSEDQKTKIYDLAITRIKNIDAVKEKYKGQEDKKKTADAEIQAFRITYRQSVKALLTPDQLTKVKAAIDAKGQKGNNSEGL